MRKLSLFYSVVLSCCFSFACSASGPFDDVNTNAGIEDVDLNLSAPANFVGLLGIDRPVSSVAELYTYARANPTYFATATIVSADSNKILTAGHNVFRLGDFSYTCLMIDVGASISFVCEPLANLDFGIDCRLLKDFQSYIEDSKFDAAMLHWSKPIKDVFASNAPYLNTVEVADVPPVGTKGFFVGGIANGEPVSLLDAERATALREITLEPRTYNSTESFMGIYSVGNESLEYVDDSCSLYNDSLIQTGDSGGALYYEVEPGKLAVYGVASSTLCVPLAAALGAYEKLPSDRQEACRALVEARKDDYLIRDYAKSVGDAATVSATDFICDNRFIVPSKVDYELGRSNKPDVTTICADVF